MTTSSSQGLWRLLGGTELVRRRHFRSNRGNRRHPRRLQGLERLEDRALLSATLPLVPAGPQGAAVQQSSPDVALNSSTAGNQDSPAVAMDASGNYVVAWTTYGQSGDRSADGNIMARQFNRLGKPLGTEVVVNTYLSGSQVQPAVAMDPEGNFVVVWSGRGPIGTNGQTDLAGVFFRRFTSDGIPLDLSDYVAATYTKGTQEMPSVAADSQGNFVVTWSGEGREGIPTGKGRLDSRGVWSRRFSKSGLPLDRYQVLVNTPAHKATTQEASDVAVDGAGNYYIVWRSAGQDGGVWGVYGQRFLADGSRNGGEIHLNRNRYGTRITPRVAMDAQGRSDVVWSGIRRDAYSVHVYARRFDKLGAAVGGDREFVVDGDPDPKKPYLKQQAQVAMNSAGDFAVTWSSFGQDQADESDRRDDGVYMRLFHSDGSEFRDPASGLPLGEFRVNATTPGSQNSPDVAMDPNGRIIAVWAGPDADRGGIWGRRMAISVGSSASIARDSSQDIALLAAVSTAECQSARLPAPTLDGLVAAKGMAPKFSAADLAFAIWAADPRKARETL